MAIIHSCCCWKSLRNGSLACGIYSLIYYTILVVAGTFHVENWGTPFDNNTMALSLGQDTEVARPVSVVIIICSALAVVASIILLIGLRMDNRLMLIPWVIIITVTTLVDLVYTIYSIGTTVIYPVFATIVTVDFFICLLNIYCILCVVSQYQEYKDGRGTALHDLQLQVFGGTVEYSAKGDRKHFINGKLHTGSSVPAPNGLLAKVQSVPNNRRIGQPNHDRQLAPFLDPISEGSNADEVPLNGSGVLTCTDEDERTSESSGRDGGPRCQPPPPRLNGAEDAVNTGGGVQAARRVKFCPVVVDSLESIAAAKRKINSVDDHPRTIDIVDNWTSSICD